MCVYMCICMYIVGDVLVSEPPGSSMPCFGCSPMWQVPLTGQRLDQSCNILRGWKKETYYYQPHKFMFPNPETSLATKKHQSMTTKEHLGSEMAILCAPFLCVPSHPESRAPDRTHFPNHRRNQRKQFLNQREKRRRPQLQEAAISWLKYLLGIKTTVSRLEIENILGLGESMMKKNKIVVAPRTLTNPKPAGSASFYSSHPSDVRTRVDALWNILTNDNFALILDQLRRLRLSVLEVCDHVRILLMWHAPARSMCSPHAGVAGCLLATGGNCSGKGNVGHGPWPEVRVVCVGGHPESVWRLRCQMLVKHKR